MNPIKIYLKRMTPLMRLWYKTNKQYDILLSRMSPVLASKRVYRRVFGRPLDLDNPRGFNEKLMWLKLFWRHPLVSKCADKYAVREYLKECGCDNALNTLIGVYNNVKEIHWDNLPDMFVLKCTHGSGYNIICHDKHTIDQRRALNKLHQWMNTNYGHNYAELHYSAIKPRIICEEYLQPHSVRPPNDYKIFCFNGNPEFVLVCQDTDLETSKHFYHDINTWELLPYNELSKLSKGSKEKTDKPPAIDQMRRLSRTLASPFPFVRVDFYDNNGKAIFGEMTFTPAGCVDSKLLPEVDVLLGQMLHLPHKYTV